MIVLFAYDRIAAPEIGILEPGGRRRIDGIDAEGLILPVFCFLGTAGGLMPGRRYFRRLDTFELLLQFNDLLLERTNASQPGRTEPRLGHRSYV